MSDYYKTILAVKPAVESLTGQTWSLPETYDRDDSRIRAPQPPLGYEFMVYLRHHGFPSPLLDWTRSPYVAAFFAYRSKETKEEPDVAIYSYVEFYGHGKGGIDDKARIVSLGPYVVAPRRHYSQQSEYTICEKHDGRQYFYWSHEDSFDGNGQRDEDLVTKFIMPRSERTKVMRKLEVMNITSYALFGNEESLMETLAYQEIERRTV
jgi:FRG domain